MEKMIEDNELVDIKDVCKIIMHNFTRYTLIKGTYTGNKYVEWQEDFVKFSDILDAVKNMPTIEQLKESNTGKWLAVDYNFPDSSGNIIYIAVCNKCGGISYFRKASNNYVGAKYCPCCGIPMDDKQNGMIRGEQYNCEGFKPEEGSEE